MRSDRFHIDLDSDEELSNVKPSGIAAPTDFNLGLVGDIKERISSSDVRPPSPGMNKNPGSGFPAHKIRSGTSRFKRKREAYDLRKQDSVGNQAFRSSKDGTPPPSQASGVHLEGRDRSIDEENTQRLAQMSESEIEEAKRELLAGLGPSLIERLLKKASIEEKPPESRPQIQPVNIEETQGIEKPVKKVTFEDSFPSSMTEQVEKTNPSSISLEDTLLNPSPDLHPADSLHPLPLPPGIHFPKQPKLPELDPSDPNFLQALHSTYYPSLPADPSNLAWMTPISPDTEANSAYSPSQQSLPPSALRFDFRGRLLPPRLSAQIPVTKGLHHHGHAPSSAGYTIPELAHLARSTYPAQRCIAFQTLGRILYRLGRGDFGQEGEDLCEGLWQLMDECRVVENLTSAAGKGQEGGNRSVWVTATDAVWLWRQGGGRKWQGR